ncbi:hypothetical protein FOCC_FOCC013963, partial [Frankliniella occidentalis]
VYSCGQIEQGGVFIDGFRTTHFNPQKPNENQTVSCRIIIKERIDDSWWVTAFADKWSNNQWKKNYFVFHFPIAACTSMRTNAPGSFQLLFKPESMTGECFISA